MSFIQTLLTIGFFNIIIKRKEVRLMCDGGMAFVESNWIECLGNAP